MELFYEDGKGEESGMECGWEKDSTVTCMCRRKEGRKEMVSEYLYNYVTSPDTEIMLSRVNVTQVSSSSN
jgi:hypothetical protein